MAKSRTEKKRVGIWIRVSTEDQAQGESPEHHKHRAHSYADAKGWDVVEVYDLAGVSGKVVTDHPEAKRMLADIEKGHITGLIFSKLARLARNTRELLDISDRFRELGADLISLEEAIDTSSPAGRLFYTMIAAMAQWEREEISARVQASVQTRAQLGKPLGGAAPYGYKWEGNQLVIEPDEAIVRKLIFDLFLEHKRKKTIARLLNEQGHRTRKGSKFSDTTIDRLLRDPIAKGERRSNYTRSTGDGKHWELKSKDEWVITKVEPIVSEEIWESCNAILDAQRNSRRKPTRKATHLFAGLTHCSCGGKMYVPSNTPKYVCYTCRNKIPVDDLESIFHEQLKSFFFSPDDIASHLNQLDSTIADKEENLAVLERESAKLTKDMDKLYDLYLAGEIPKAGFGKKYQPLQERLDELDHQIPTLRGEIDFMKIQHLSSDKLIEESQDLYSRWESLERPQKRHIVETITEEIVVDKDEITINLCYLPSPEMMVSGQRNLRDSSPRSIETGLER